MDKIVYLDLPTNRNIEQQISLRQNEQDSDAVSQEHSFRDNVALLEREGKRLASPVEFGKRPPSYRTMQVYDFATMLSEYGIRSGPLSRLASNHDTSNLPNIAVVHCDQMQGVDKQAVLLGRTIFMSHTDFEIWVKGHSFTEIQDRILLLLTKFLAFGNRKPV